MQSFPFRFLHIVFVKVSQYTPRRNCCHIIAAGVFLLFIIFYLSQRAPNFSHSPPPRPPLSPLQTGLLLPSPLPPLPRDTELASQFHLKPATHYSYLNQSGCVRLDGVNDAERFDALRLAFSVLQIPQEVCEGLYATISAILWLGNISFQVR